MKNIVMLICALFIGTQATQAQSFKDFFSRKNISRIASSAGINAPLKVEGTWKYAGTAIELKTENALKKAAAEVAAVAAEEKVNNYLSQFGINTNNISISFEKEGKFAVKAIGREIPGTYEISEDKKSITLKFTDRISFTPDISHTLDTLSLLFEADKLMEFMNYISQRTDISSLKAINALAQNYDGLKVGVQLEKTK